MICLSLSGGVNNFLQFFTVLLIFLFVLAVTLVTTRWIASYQKEKTAGGNIEVLETYRVAANKYVQIVRVGERYLAVAVGKDEITMLAELEKEELVFTVSETNDFADFKSVLEKVKSLKNKEK